MKAEAPADGIRLGKDQTDHFLAKEEESPSFWESVERLVQPSKAADQRIALTDQVNIYYYGALEIGSPFQTMSRMIFDNAYEFNLVEYNGCYSGCTSPVFESGSSTTYALKTNPNPMPTGLSYVQLSSDRICLSKNAASCTPTSFEWYGLLRKSGWPPSSMDGVISLWSGRVKGAKSLFVPLLH
mmetsp:Transcript_2321/g.3166  ORF Transcript_2321/g.3166 Transcript_2321/m.3166 type:complete len:184 (+) Transcript_2321:125-676(+)|eukprot:CAMPEP_0185574826 /NCGR_PEP_ID=MMETSP0434-20130131/6185_1 /TAXON_ID=626734 ORGANISM="Favella taraikaensis, Strain Fe Narragansett Bay" /NCGR_SAMPLE_ID=MMETSP0434 /ASSEMBLY_ACC=CAM_ASM_000379 /LENGTH=183 /DNA_ID=CAMNT_0028191513 /DNA_START=118 /DNA_END=672 /DNA_ORIENTATION=+